MDQNRGCKVGSRTHPTLTVLCAVYEQLPKNISTHFNKIHKDMLTSSRCLPIPHSNPKNIRHTCHVSLLCGIRKHTCSWALLYDLAHVWPHFWATRLILEPDQISALQGDVCPTNFAFTDHGPIRCSLSVVSCSDEVLTCTVEVELRVFFHSVS